MANQKATRDVVDLVTRPITQGIRVQGDNGPNFQLDGVSVGLVTPGVAAFSEITMSGEIDLDGNRLVNVPSPASGTDGVNRDYVDSQIAASLTTIVSIPVGGIVPFAGNEAAVPSGWLLCDGASYTSAGYPALHSVLSASGYPYGGSGANFNVPDLRGNILGGRDNMGGVSRNRVANVNADTLGGELGEENHTLTTSEMPSHRHRVLGSGDTSDPNVDSIVNENAAVAGEQSGLFSYVYTNAAGTSLLVPEGGGSAHNNMQPTMFMNYIIRAE